MDGIGKCRCIHIEHHVREGDATSWAILAISFKSFTMSHSTFVLLLDTREDKDVLRWNGERCGIPQRYWLLGLNERRLHDTGDGASRWTEGARHRIDLQHNIPRL